MVDLGNLATCVVIVHGLMLIPGRRQGKVVGAICVSPGLRLAVQQSLSAKITLPWASDLSFLNVVFLMKLDKGKTGDPGPLLNIGT